MTAAPNIAHLQPGVIAESGSARATPRQIAASFTLDRTVPHDQPGQVWTPRARPYDSIRATHAGMKLPLLDRLGTVQNLIEGVADPKQLVSALPAGQTLRQQTAFSEYPARRAAEPSYTFRQHLRRTGGAIEEYAAMTASHR